MKVIEAIWDSFLFKLLAFFFAVFAALPWVIAGLIMYADWCHTLFKGWHII